MDFEVFLKMGYGRAFVIGHNGQIFEYSASKNIDDKLYNSYIDKYRYQKYTEFEAQVTTLRIFQEHGDIDFWEVT